MAEGCYRPTTDFDGGRISGALHAVHWLEARPARQGDGASAVTSKRTLQGSYNVELDASRLRLKPENNSATRASDLLGKFEHRHRLHEFLRLTLQA